MLKPSTDLKNNTYVLDFETRNSNIDISQLKTSVWLWDVCNITTLDHSSGYDMDSFIDYVKSLCPCVMYSHNLKFDGAFIIDYLLKNGYVYTQDRKPKKKQFKALINEMKEFYSISVYFSKNKCVEFRDSTKKIKGKVSDIAKSYKLPILKGEIDYRAYRPIGYIASKEELEYIKNDTEIIARVLYIQYIKGKTRLTTASDTLEKYKQSLNGNFELLFPQLDLETDEEIRKAYRGGVCQVKNCWKGVEINKPIYKYDFNSHYPAQMVYRPLPYGKPKRFKGKYKDNNVYPLYIQHIEVDLKLKEGYQATILNGGLFGELSYIETTEGQLKELWLSSIDLELMFKHYEVYDINYLDGIMFMASTNLFKDYMLPLYEHKCNSTGAEKEDTKLELNGLYGKFATNPKHISKMPYIESDVVKYSNSDMEEGKTIYTAVSVFITAWARYVLFSLIQSNYENFVYCDTDSLHLLGEINNLEWVDNKKLGYLKQEEGYIKSKYIAQKCYLGLKEDRKTLDIKVAGASNEVKKQISFDNFKIGCSFGGKLRPLVVNGGVLLVDTTFTIKKR